MYLIPIPAFTDNYHGLLHDGKRALVVDPGDAGPVPRVLAQHAVQLESILVTRTTMLPTSIAQELLVNPFLPTRQATIMAAARRFDASVHDDNTVFAAIRQ